MGRCTRSRAIVRVITEVNLGGRARREKEDTEKKLLPQRHREHGVTEKSKIQKLRTISHSGSELRVLCVSVVIISPLCSPPPPRPDGFIEWR
jgi:hypothetical protein